jgi:hypothetical protein
MDKALRNTLRNVVTQCRRELEKSVAEMLEGQFGIYATGKIDDIAAMSHLSAVDREYRSQLLVHLEHIQAGGFKAKDAVEQFIREVAFTHLNRFCAYKMMEVRKLIRESVSRGYESNNVKFYLAEHPEDERLYNAGQQDVAYRHFLEWLGGTLSEEIGVLFSPHDPANRLLPQQRVLDQVLGWLNSEALKDIWAEDETIGWIYQYFTPKELRDQARKESQAPRNSYELAFRNQFYTPSYVVQFLTDNTLGRIWYEMRQGETDLKDLCQYMVCRPNEVFLVKGESAPVETQDDGSLSQEELLQQPVYISYRKLKDPREIRVLDPACGSGHFLLYCFTLLLAIYEEAWESCPDVLCNLRNSGLNKEAFMQQLPGLILAHNLHGIDIDIRATQIAALALWLRAQRAYQEMGLKKNRPKITKSNIVCAEPMPGNKLLLEEFVSELQPKILGQLIQVIFEKMSLVGEVGSLLRIEEEIRDAITEAKKQWKAQPKEEQLALLPELILSKSEQLIVFDIKEITDEEFWDEAEVRVISALQEYAQHTVGTQRLQRQLFTDDAVQGFAFVDICRKRFDVVLMNPPFGLGLKNNFSWLKKNYPNAYVNIYASFVSRGLQLCIGKLGAITSRSFLIVPKLSKYRERNILPSLDLILDLGEGVMDDAMVLSCSYVLDLSKNFNEKILSFERKTLSDQSLNLDKAIRFEEVQETYLVNRHQLIKTPKSQILYSLPSNVLSLLDSNSKLGDKVLSAKQGMKTFKDFRFLRLRWEVKPEDIGEAKEWEPISKGGPYATFYSDLPLVVRWAKTGDEIAEENRRSNGQTAQARQASTYYRLSGGTYSYRSRKGFGVRVLPAECIIGNKGPAVLPKNEFSADFIIAFLNSRFFNLLVTLQANDSQYDTGILERLPWVEPSENAVNDIKSFSIEAIESLRFMASFHEADSLFLRLPFSNSLSTITSHWQTLEKESKNKIENCLAEINKIVDKIYQIDSLVIERSVGALEGYENSEIDEAQKVDEDEDEESNSTLSITTRYTASAYLSFAAGCVLGKWDIRLSLKKILAPKFSELFSKLPRCSPGTLIKCDGLPAINNSIVSEEWLGARPDVNTFPSTESVKNPTISNSEYPIEIDWDGILVDDPDHPDDILCRIRDVLEVLWGDRAEDIEREACEILDVSDLRDYFRKPGNGGFWQDHIKRYSKSRRKAPIYWLLQSSKKSYALWLYYHRLDKDILFKAHTLYAEPKLNLETDELRRLKNQRAGLTGTALKKLERDIEKQENLVSELQDFSEKLQRAAKLDFGGNLNPDVVFDPDLNDGVVLNIAPLWELVPWSEAKKYWQDLIQGKYEWSSISKQLQAKGII